LLTCRIAADFYLCCHSRCQSLHTPGARLVLLHKQYTTQSPRFVLERDAFSPLCWPGSTEQQRNRSLVLLPLLVSLESTRSFLDHGLDDPCQHHPELDAFSNCITLLKANLLILGTCRACGPSLTPYPLNDDALNADTIHRATLNPRITCCSSLRRSI
jgi:hypothetical protein